jgi:dolichyl-phosphate-mannose-protein mannosyltransferase
VPVATIGGEPGGRAPIVVPDMEKIDHAGDEHTSIAEGKAEPGHDIFAGEVVKDVKSEAPLHPLPPVDDREIISVITTGTTAATSEGTDSATNSDTSTSEGSSSVTTTSSESPNTAGTSTSGTTAEAPHMDEQKEGPHMPAGPLREEEAEAEKVANELFGDAEK